MIPCTKSLPGAASKNYTLMRSLVYSTLTREVIGSSKAMGIQNLLIPFDALPDKGKY